MFAGASANQKSQVQFSQTSYMGQIGQQVHISKHQATPVASRGPNVVMMATATADAAVASKTDDANYMDKVFL